MWLKNGGRGEGVGVLSITKSRQTKLPEQCRSNSKQEGRKQQEENSPESCAPSRIPSTPPPQPRALRMRRLKRWTAEELRETMVAGRSRWIKSETPGRQVSYVRGVTRGNWTRGLVLPEMELPGACVCGRRESRILALKLRKPWRNLINGSCELGSLSEMWKEWMEAAKRKLGINQARS